jgi:neurofibromin 1
MTQITDADKIAKAMIVVFQDAGKVLHLLEAFIAEEVRNADSAGTLFRSNSMVSKMFKFYSRLIGLPYLYTTIGPELNELIEEELGLEVDPEKMEEGTDLDEMRWTLMAQSQKILKTILASDVDCPPQFRQLFAHIRKCVAERFPENVNTTIGGFVFLRFFCPAVSSPEAYGIVEEPPSADARRLLILITKVLQNLSNDVEFGSKEPYMTKMNDFIHSNRDKLSAFYEKLIKPSVKQAVAVDLPKNMKQVSVATIANHIRDNLSKIENASIRQRLESVVNG